MTIYFYKINDEYGCFSNFSHYGFELYGKWWMTSEHYFQAQKFHDTKYEEIIRLLDNPMKAAEMGRNRNLPLRKDWEEVKDAVMKKLCWKNLSKMKQYVKCFCLQGRIVLLKRPQMIITGDAGRMALERIC